MELHPLLPYLPYLIGIPFSVLVTCIVLVLVVIGTDSIINTDVSGLPNQAMNIG